MILVEQTIDASNVVADEIAQTGKRVTGAAFNLVSEEFCDDKSHSAPNQELWAFGTEL